MYDDILLDKTDEKVTNINLNNPSANLNDIDDLFNNLTSDIASVNKFISNLNEQKKVNSTEEQELLEEKEKLAKERKEFDNYIKSKKEEICQKQNQAEAYLTTQRQYLSKSESEFKTNMDNSLSELELAKKELEIKKEKIKEEKEQFDTYKSLEMNRIHHAEEILASEKEQFEKYKEVTVKKIELENKNLEQKCARFKEIIGQFNSNFRPIIESKEE